MAYDNNSTGTGSSGSGGKILILTEKPSVAQNIGDALGVHGSKTKGYFEDERYVITWCIGHLVELAQPAAYGPQYEKWTYNSLPIIPADWKYEIKSSTKKQFEVVRDLMQGKNFPIFKVCLATDPGREGEAIGRLVYEMAGCTRPMERLWVSSMEESAIREGMKNLKPSREYDDLYAAALCRQHADWLVGINGTRLFTVIYGGKTLKVGRVQTPTLSMLVDRESQIMTFKKEPYFVTHLSAENCSGLDAVTEHLKDKEEADRVANVCTGGIALVTAVTRETKSQKPPLLYDLTSLQRDANRLLGYTAKQTLEYAQNLYEKKLLTYPRTDSNYLSDDMEDTARQVIEAIYQTGMYEENPFETPNAACLLNSKKVSDHHALIPTVEIGNGKLQDIPGPERRLLELVSMRLLQATGEKMVYETVKAEISCSGYSFHASGKTILQPGFSVFEDQFRKRNALRKDDEENDKNEEHDKNDEKSLPKISEGQLLQPVLTRVTKHFTAPPKRYTEAALLAAMERAGASEMNENAERKGLGTPATRADIIEKLVADGFVKREKKTLVPTQDGINLITILPDLVKSPQMTAEWENALTDIAKGNLEPIQFMGGIEELVERLVATYSSATSDQKNLFSNKPEVLGSCPNCGSDMVKGRYGIYCKGKCGMTIGKFMGKAFSDEQVKALLAGSRILMKGLKSSAGKTYSAYLYPNGAEKYSYIRDGQEKSGYQLKFRMEFPDHNGNSKKRKENKQA